VRGIKQKSNAQSPSAIELCSLVLCFDLRITSLLMLNLMTTFACYLSLYGACSYNLIGATWNFTFVVCLVMVLWIATDGAMTKPRASCGCRHMAGCLTRAGIMVSSHDPLWNDGRCIILSCPFFLVISPYRIVRSISQTKSSRASIWRYIKDNLWRIVINININRLQEAIDKWLYLAVLVLMSII
jgi:hypothetical protein